MDLVTIFQQVLNGLSIGSVYAIFALGYTLIFSILGIINFAHGAIFTLGAYFTYALAGGVFGFNGLLANAKLPFSLPFFLALLLGCILSGFTSVLLERLAFKPLRVRGSDSLLTLVSSLGAAVVIVNVIQYLVGAEIYTFPDGIYGNLPPAINFGTDDRPVAIRTIQIIIFLVSAVMVALLTYWVNFTKMGKALQAVAEDVTTASLLGINPEKFIVITFFISGALAGLAGTLVGSSVSIAGPYFGIAFGLKGLGVIVLGGLGSIPGAVIGGLLLGIAEAFVPAEYSGYREAIAFAILFIMLLVRPQGLLGRKLIEKV
ncbi:high-affinity branched-chain amino acid transport system permease protein LivH [Microcystis aeruginosa NIES-1211]|uniref:High-affinity branched-chain amino acid transport system permease protein LivH n=1 Tax=Microcystis aeruginosa NIES-2519 TaxID=2303981 RepID=A0A5A5R9Y3_MICAE|nr:MULTISPECIES: branched-chain amino acid ABC transporter permease [Microcystis]AVQ71905.1 branched-chain amino acid ABC transporter permease [Microcystis sp. MC19]CCI34572.1 Inner-membrane translocator [Microcystis sp. T1-4]GBL14630.1 high-affinity branched-chain amino acid transport system permease protein LivH [Microcystis aeruginosa NIES-1211]GCA71858.1 high-affinity branched-chain amino acid transport system permease protein LivH [Microcystis aeruginosa NIES-2519]GCA84948.1 high-affinity